LQRSWDDKQDLFSREDRVKDERNQAELQEERKQKESDEVKSTGK
jgi:hypothetical protein